MEYSEGPLTCGRTEQLAGLPAHRRISMAAPGEGADRRERLPGGAGLEAAGIGLNGLVATLMKRFFGCSNATHTRGCNLDVGKR